MNVRVLRKGIVILGVTVFLLMGSFGMSHIGMSTQMDGQMSDCPLTPGVAICNMNPLEMIAASQSLLNTLPMQKDLAILLLLLMAAWFATIVFLRPLSPPRLLTQNPASNRKYIPLSMFLQEAFSNGILNPKLY